MSTYICEVCDVTEELEPDGAFNSGWDYPPFMGAWGVVGARTCPSCTIDKTAWFALISGTPPEELSDRHMNTVIRILQEEAE